MKNAKQRLDVVSEAISYRLIDAFARYLQPHVTVQDYDEMTRYACNEVYLPILLSQEIIGLAANRDRRLQETLHHQLHELEHEQGYDWLAGYSGGASYRAYQRSPSVSDQRLVLALVEAKDFLGMISAVSLMVTTRQSSSLLHPSSVSPSSDHPSLIEKRLLSLGSADQDSIDRYGEQLGADLLSYPDNFWNLGDQQERRYTLDSGYDIGLQLDHACYISYLRSLMRAELRSSRAELANDEFSIGFSRF